MNKSLELKSVKCGETIHVRAGEEPKAYLYDFEVLEFGEMPKCNFTQTSPGGELVGPFVVYVEGTGDWTDQR